MASGDKERRRRIEALLQVILTEPADSQPSKEAKNELLSLVYDELRAMAFKRMAGERKDLTLEPDELVTLSYLKIFVGSPLRIADAAFFFAAAARAMQQVLIDHARGRNARPQGRRVTLVDILLDHESTHRVTRHDLFAALEELKQVSQRQYDAVVLKFFGGLGCKEIAEWLEPCVSVSTVEKDWQVCRAWLFRRLRNGR